MNLIHARQERLLKAAQAAQRDLNKAALDHAPRKAMEAAGRKARAEWDAYHAERNGMAKRILEAQDEEHEWARTSYYHALIGMLDQEPNAKRFAENMQKQLIATFKPIEELERGRLAEIDKRERARARKFFTSRSIEPKGRITLLIAKL